MRLQEAIDELGLSAAPNPDLPFQGGALGVFGDLIAAWKRCHRLRRRIFRCRIWRWDLRLALIVDHHKQVVSPAQPFDVNASGSRWKQQACSRAGFPSDLCVAFNMTPQTYARKIRTRRRICKAAIVIR